jgi:hypothetical protein
MAFIDIGNCTVPVLLRASSAPGPLTLMTYPGTRLLALDLCRHKGCEGEAFEALMILAAML